jgi:hypothetical protein
MQKLKTANGTLLTRDGAAEAMGLSLEAFEIKRKMDGWALMPYCADGKVYTLYSIPAVIRAGLKWNPGHFEELVLAIIPEREVIAWAERWEGYREKLPLGEYRSAQIFELLGVRSNQEKKELWGAIPEVPWLKGRQDRTKSRYIQVE